MSLRLRSRVFFSAFLSQTNRHLYINSLEQAFPHPPSASSARSLSAAALYISPFLCYRFQKLGFCLLTNFLKGLDFIGGTMMSLRESHAPLWWCLHQSVLIIFSYPYIFWAPLFTSTFSFLTIFLPFSLFCDFPRAILFLSKIHFSPTAYRFTLIMSDPSHCFLDFHSFCNYAI